MNQQVSYYMTEHTNGRNFWKFMHTTAAYYPQTPTEEQQKEMRFFISKSAKYFLLNNEWKIYWKDRIKAHPPKVSNDKDLAKWVCEEHNYLNEALGRDLFSCRQENLKNRWGPFINK
jgi:FAD-linked sulfhydryl oxidase